MTTNRQSRLESWEVSLTKRMLCDGQLNKQEIHSYFTRPGRTINQGRISEIADGKRHAAIPAATEEDVSAFLGDYQDDYSGVKRDFFRSQPLHESRLSHLLRLRNGEPPILDIEESDDVEWKLSYNWNSRAEYGRVMASFANNRGGYILFGIHPQTREVVGIRQGMLERRDPADYSQFLNQHLVPAMRWERREFEFAGKTIGVIYTWTSSEKPVICTQNAGNALKEAEIYHRYVGVTRRIGYSELAALFREREKRIEERWRQTMRRIADGGIENIALMNTLTGHVEGPGGTFLIDEELVKKLSFIREGEFSERQGSLTLKLIGQLESVASDVLRPTKEVIRRDVITERNLIDDFVAMSDVDNPLGYIRQLCHVQARWLPIYYYIHQSRMTIQEAIDLLDGIETSHKANKQWQIERLREQKAPPAVSLSSQKEHVGIVRWRGQWDTSDPQDALRFLRAVRVLREAEIDQDYLRPLIAQCVDSHYGAAGDNVKQEIRYAVCHLDEQLYGSRLRGVDAD